MNRQAVSVELEMMALLRAATQHGQAELDDREKAAEERFHFKVKEGIARSTKAAEAIMADSTSPNADGQDPVRACWHFVIASFFVVGIWLFVGICD